MTQAERQQLFTDLFAQTERQLYRFVFSMMGNHADTDDVLGETLSRLWEHFDDYDAARPFGPWAMQFAYRQVLSHRRSRATHRKYFSDAVIELLAAERPVQLEHAAERKAALADCMKRLEDDERAVIRHRYESDTDLGELAEQTGRSANSPYKQLQRVRAKLMQCIRRKMSQRGYDA